MIEEWSSFEDLMASLSEKYAADLDWENLPDPFSESEENPARKRRCRWCTDRTAPRRRLSSRLRRTRLADRPW